MRRSIGFLAKLLRAAPDRPTRLHDGKGNRVSIRRLIRNGPQALISGLLRLLFQIWPERPWISYDATTRLARHLNPNSVVLEYGSGRSTIWLARQSDHVYSIEDSPAWYQRVQGLLHDHRLANTTYSLQTTPDDYINFPNQPGLLFDLIIVDGSHRTACVQAAIGRLQPGGILYIDNSDGDLRDAEQIVAAMAEREHGQLCFYTDFVPTQLYVSQGLLYQRPFLTR
ncbi:MAG: class I SAM-dependent methyltransferase [Roseiflexaceae bacterium]|nr:class I SAM-dependent methyltransferase [Roseiflexaceae bacterium]